MIEHCGQFCRFTVINDCVTNSSLAKRCTQDNGSSTRCETAQRTFLNNYRINYFEYLFSNAADLTKLSRNRRCRSLTSSQSTSRRQRGKIRRTLKRKFDSLHLIKKIPFKNDDQKLYTIFIDQTSKTQKNLFIFHQD